MNRRGPSIVLVLAALAVSACDRDGASSAATGPFAFTDVTRESGIHFVHENGALGKRHLPETMGGSAAWLDADQDGDLDLFLGQSGPLPERARAPSRSPARNGLFRNDGALRFTDVTDASGDARSTGYGQGVAAGDFDGDGLVDLFVVNFGPDVLLESRGTCAFDDVTQRAGIAEDRWGTSACLFDMDADGDLDIYVANYLDYSIPVVLERTRGEGYIAYPHPDKFESAPDQLWRNEGNGTFVDATAAAGIKDVDGKGLGVAAVDLDDDGDLDVYVANDSTPNFLYRNDGAGHFTDVTEHSNAGYSADGRTQASMGIGVGDVDGDLRPELFVTNLDSETNALYHNLGDLVFEDDSLVRGLAAPSLPFVGFGTGMCDFDLDGDLDVFVGNGHIIDNIARFDPMAGSTYRERILFFENNGGGRFAELGDAACAALRTERVVRAAAFGDPDDDGDVDVVLAQNAASAVLLRNDGERRGHFLRIEFRDAHGAPILPAAVTLTCGGRKLAAPCFHGGSYCAVNDPRILVGVPTPRVERVDVRYVGGSTLTLQDVASDAMYIVGVDGKPTLVPRSK